MSFLTHPERKKMEYDIVVIEESNPTLRGRIVSALADEGFRVTTAASSDEALMKLGELTPQLIILGEGLSVDCFDACCQLRQATDVPILMIGTVPTPYAWVRVVEAGADFYLRKPFSYLELTTRVRALLRRNGKNINRDDEKNLKF